jgi:16S rRNA (guanine527-N7)-methyltransferase
MCVFLKGRTAAEELRDARRRWQMKASIVPSRTDPDASILIIQQVGRA